MFIDIHNHSLYGVDDGPRDPELCRQMLKDAADQGASAIIFTPHYRREMFEYPLEAIEKDFSSIKPYAEELGLEVFLGCEYHVDSELIDNIEAGRIHTLADSDYVLTEYSQFTPIAFIEQQTDRLIRFGYKPVIAHVERYNCFRNKPSLIGEISERGALIQVNAGSIMGAEGLGQKLFTRKLLKAGLVDMIASDSHDLDQRRSRMQECMTFVKRKYGHQYAEALFFEAAEHILNNSKSTERT